MMRRIISSILLVILVAVTIGVPVYRHTCHVFDRSEVSLLTQKQCCTPGESNSEASLDFKCCSLEHFDTALDYETLTEKSVAINLDLALVAVIETNYQVSETQQVNRLPVLRAPPVANRVLLNKIQVYII